MSFTFFTKIISLVGLLSLILIPNSLVAKADTFTTPCYTEPNGSKRGFKPVPSNFHLQSFSMQMPCTAVATWSRIKLNPDGTQDLKLEISQGQPNNTLLHLTLVFIQGSQTCIANCIQTPTFDYKVTGFNQNGVKIISESAPTTNISTNPAFTPNNNELIQYSSTIDVPINTPLGINYVTKKPYPFGLAQTKYTKFPNGIISNTNVFAVKTFEDLTPNTTIAKFHIDLKESMKSTKFK
jgi:hypothetical protein